MVVATAVVASLIGTAPAWGRDTGDSAIPEPLPLWEQTLYKTLTYQTASNISDLALYAVFLGGTATASAGFVAANVTSAMALYYGHDYAWETLGPSPEDKSHQTVAEKTVTYRVLAIAKNFVLGYAFGGSVVAATGFVAAGIITDSIIFVGNEYAWDAFRPRKVEARAAPARQVGSVDVFTPR